MLEVRDISLEAGTQPDGEPLWLLRSFRRISRAGTFARWWGPPAPGKARC